MSEDRTKKIREKNYHTPPSDDFKDVLISTGSIVAECSYCERVYFCNPKFTSFEYDIDEYENYLKSAKEEPDKYIEVFEDGISCGWIDNVEGPLNCKCNIFGRYELFLVNERDKIITFFKNTVVKEFEKAKKSKELFEELSGEKLTSNRRRVILVKDKGKGKFRQIENRSRIYGEQKNGKERV